MMVNDNGQCLFKKLGYNCKTKRLNLVLLFFKPTKFL